MLGLIIGILGVISVVSLWDYQNGLAIFILIVTLYQFSSLNEMMKENQGLQYEDKAQTSINMVASLIILIAFIYSLTL